MDDKMNALFIDARVGGDFTLDAVWAGLIDRFGFSHVFDYGPCQEKHRLGVPSVTGDAERDYGAERKSLCYVQGCTGLPRYTRDDINGLIKGGLISIIFIDEREESYRLYLETVARWYAIPVVVIAGHDRFWNINPDQPLDILKSYYGKNLEALFIDNWREQYDKLDHVFPMSYATNFDHLWEVERRQEFLKNKVYDVCFMGYNSHGDRARFVEHLIKKYENNTNCVFVEKRPDIMDTFIRKNEYFKKMAQSRICVNLRGAAECGKALRFYEIPYVGSYMLSQRDTARQVHPFLERVGKNLGHCNYFNTEVDLDRKIYGMLQLPDIREMIARNGHEHAMKFHTARARVDYMFGCING